jgi:hypothetical protein
MARNPSAQSLDHGGGTSREGRSPVSWCLFDEKVGSYGGRAALGSQNAWESQMECFLKVRRLGSRLMIGSIQWSQEYSVGTSITGIRRDGCRAEGAGVGSQSEYAQSRQSRVRIRQRESQERSQTIHE